MTSIRCTCTTHCAASYQMSDKVSALWCKEDDRYVIEHLKKYLMKYSRTS